MNLQRFLLLASWLWGALWAQDIRPQRIEPPFWWDGMRNPELELLVYGEQIGDCRASVAYPGVTLLGATRTENPNYLFLSLRIDTALAQPGLMPIVLERGAARVTIGYELKARSLRPESMEGVTSGDLIYLLMPDRFANGDAANDNVPGMLQPKASRTGQYQRHGGDLQGVIQRLGYLDDLGVTALWLNPVLENNQPRESYHGYAVTDHYRVDARLGGNDAYVRLADSAHARGMKLVQDMVFNHCGNEHWLMKDLPARDWIHQQDTFRKTNYRAPILSDPYASKADYDLMVNGWFDTHMPDLNQQNPHLARYLIQNSIWWVEYAKLDGYRIDTYAYPDQVFMADWNRALLREYPHLGIFGEIWDQSFAAQAWFAEGQRLHKPYDSHLPGVTDFQIHFALLDALNQNFGWSEGLAKLYIALAGDYQYVDPMKNVVFLDNHDVGRFYSAVKEDFNAYKMGLGFLLTTRGIPQVYYGTEILMKNNFDWGNHDKVREEFPGGWPGDKVNKFAAAGRTPQEQAAFTFFRTLANYRRTSSALRTGKLMQFVPENGTYVYFRYDPKQTVMVAMNQQSTEAKLSTARFAERMQGFTRARDVVTGKELSSLGQLTLPPRSITILELVR
ncbi:MAG: glycoside hydrolase family 13 protein [Bacteroidia bacterium]|nr:glycoside hydrolase family 13 protein [Bacteroidia bacterium]